MSNIKYKRQSPQKWAEDFKLKILDYSKGFSDSEYESGLLSREEFLNKASLCVFEKPEALSRRDAAKYFSSLTTNK